MQLHEPDGAPPCYREDLLLSLPATARTAALPASAEDERLLNLTSNRIVIPATSAPQAGAETFTISNNTTQEAQYQPRHAVVEYDREPFQLLPRITKRHDGYFWPTYWQFSWFHYRCHLSELLWRAWWVIIVAAAAFIIARAIYRKVTGRDI
jgi:hypothetical protein